MEKYDSAAIRHFEDAELLKDSKKLDNAGHLIGFAAECAIKHKISTIHSSTTVPHGHFPDILISARKHLGQRSSYTTTIYDILKHDIFIGWSVNRRYYETGNTTMFEIDSWFNVTKRLFATAGLKRHK
ncbi:MAG: hypothetical protein ABSB19_15940 [Methylomonas sp.]